MFISNLIPNIYFVQSFHNQNKDANMEGLMGQRNRLSDMDILKINKMYNCETQKAEAAAAENVHSGDVIGGSYPNRYAL